MAANQCHSKASALGRELVDLQLSNNPHSRTRERQACKTLIFMIWELAAPSELLTLLKVQANAWLASISCVTLSMIYKTQWSSSTNCLSNAHITVSCKNYWPMLCSTIATFQSWFRLSWALRKVSTRITSASRPHSSWWQWLLNKSDRSLCITPLLWSWFMTGFPLGLEDRFRHENRWVNLMCPTVTDGCIVYRCTTQGRSSCKSSTVCNAGTLL